MTEDRFAKDVALSHRSSVSSYETELSQQPTEKAPAGSPASGAEQSAPSYAECLVPGIASKAEAWRTRGRQASRAAAADARRGWQRRDRAYRPGRGGRRPASGPRRRGQRSVRRHRASRPRNHGRDVFVRSPHSQPSHSSTALIRFWSAVPILDNSMNRPSGRRRCSRPDASLWPPTPRSTIALRPRCRSIRRYRHRGCGPAADHSQSDPVALVAEDRTPAVGPPRSLRQCKLP
jgi:hypothetical protein